MARADHPVHRLPYGYTNETREENGNVIKRYFGARARQRRAAERTCLEHLADSLPTPRLLRSSAHALEMTKLDGVHGKALIESDAAPTVMSAMGKMLERIHATKPRPLNLPGDGQCLVHGDYGPQNLLFTPSGHEVVGVLDWEWAHWGRPDEDLAWVEWIIRMFHETQVPGLRHLFEAYGWRPAWPDRRACMIEHCRALMKYDLADENFGKPNHPNGQNPGAFQSYAR